MCELSGISELRRRAIAEMSVWRRQANLCQLSRSLLQARPKGAGQRHNAIRWTTDVAAASLARHCSPAGRVAQSQASARADARAKNSIQEELNAEVAQEVRQQFFGCLFQLQSDPEAMQVGHLQLGVATRVDALKRLKININIESHSMETRASSDT